MVMRETILQAFVAELFPSDSVLAVWEMGSKAMGTADEYSDLDLQVLVADGATAEVRALVERALSQVRPFDLAFAMPQPTWHGHWQGFYRLLGTSPYLMVDLVIIEKSRPNWFLEPEIHGTPSILFDKQGLLVQEPTDAAAFAQRLADRIAFLDSSTELFHNLIDKELLRRRPVDAMSFYQGMLLPRLVEVLRMRHCPWRYNFGLRYLQRDLPAEAYEAVKTQLFVGSPSDLMAKKERTLYLFRNTLKELKRLDLAAHLEAARK